MKIWWTIVKQNNGEPDKPLHNCPLYSVFYTNTAYILLSESDLFRFIANCYNNFFVWLVFFPQLLFRMIWIVTDSISRNFTFFVKLYFYLKVIWFIAFYHYYCCQHCHFQSKLFVYYLFHMKPLKAFFQ